MVVAWSQNLFGLLAVEISAAVASAQSYVHMITEEGSHAAVSLPGCHASRHVNYVLLDCCHVHNQMTLTRYLTQVCDVFEKHLFLKTKPSRIPHA
jgi:hypothetical protein